MARAHTARLIIDTDLSTDLGDALALCTAHKLQDMGQAEIAAVLHNTGLPSGVAAVASINSYYGRSEIPVGAYKGSFLNPYSDDASPWLKAYGAGPYVEKVASKFPVDIGNSSGAPDAVKVYRRVLAESQDHSVVIASIGFLGNLAALLHSTADDSSPLSGSELVEKKVRELVVMGGRYPSSRVMHYQWNFGGGCAWGSQQCPETPTWTKTVVEGWPDVVPMTFIGYEVGLNVLTGSKLKRCVSEKNPCRFAVERFSEVDPKVPPTPSGDPITILYATLGLQKWGERHRGGINKIDENDGANEWVDGGLSHQSYLAMLPGKQEGLAEQIDQLLCSAPAVLV